MSFARALHTGLLLLLPIMATPCRADNFTFTASLNGANEVPANNSTATGFGTYVLAGNLFTVSESFAGLSAPAVAAHIHCCAPIGTNAPVVLPFTLFPSAISGTYSHIYDLSTTPLSGGLTEAQFIAGLEGGQAYANIHDANFPGGEIEGQLLPVAQTPEPNSLLLLSTGAIGAMAMLRRRLSLGKTDLR